MRPVIAPSLAFVLCLAGCAGEVLVSEGAVGGADAGVPSAETDGSLPGEAAPDAAGPIGDAPLAGGIRVAEVELYQTVAVSLARDGAPVTPRNAPVVEGAPAMFAIYVEAASGFSPRPLEARVTVDGTDYTATREVRGSSSGDPTTALRVEVPGRAITTSSTYSVSLRETSATRGPGETAGARYPAEGDAALGAVSANGPLNLVVVPFYYTADGSNRLPPTQDAVDAFEGAFRAVFPVADVEISVRQPVEMDMSLNESDGWSQWLDLLRAVRSSDNPPPNTYYYGISAPAPSLSQYCGNGCISGLGHVPSAGNSFLFASVGVSFDDSLGAGTAVHEVGHTMGRPHAPCGGPSSVDPQYPYPGASIGTWGYDARRGELKDPTRYTDVMGYCNAQWISDYQFDYIFDRISAVNGASPASLAAPQRYRVGLVDDRGEIEWRRETDMAPAAGGRIGVSLLAETGEELDSADAHYYPYDHLPGGVVYMPIDDPDSAAAVAPAGLTFAP